MFFFFFGSLLRWHHGVKILLCDCHICIWRNELSKITHTSRYEKEATRNRLAALYIPSNSEKYYNSKCGRGCFTSTFYVHFIYSTYKFYVHKWIRNRHLWNNLKTDLFHVISFFHLVQLGTQVLVSMNLTEK